MTGREQFLGKQMAVRDGQEIGAIERVFVNDTTGEPDWATVRMGVLRREHVVPLAGAQMSGDTIRVPHPEATIKNSPKLDFDDHLSPQDIAVLSKHYGTTTSPSNRAMNSGDRMPSDAESRTGTGMGTGMETGTDMGTGKSTGTQAGTERQMRPGARTGADERHTGEDIRVPQDLHREATLDATRYGERLHVAKENREAGRVRLRKYVEQTPAEQHVQLQHETYEVVRVPIEDSAQSAGTNPDWTEQVQELVLFDEQAHATKEIVPLERVVIRKKVVSEDKVLRANVRTEQFEIIEPDNVRAEAGAMSGKRTSNEQNRR